MCSRLSISSLKLDESDTEASHQNNRRSVVSSYIASQQQLACFRLDWIEMLKAAVATNAVPKWGPLAWFDEYRGQMIEALQ